MARHFVDVRYLDRKGKDNLGARMDAAVFAMLRQTGSIAVSAALATRWHLTAWAEDPEHPATA